MRPGETTTFGGTSWDGFRCFSLLGMARGVASGRDESIQPCRKALMRSMCNSTSFFSRPHLSARIDHSRSSPRRNAGTGTWVLISGLSLAMTAGPREASRVSVGERTRWPGLRIFTRYRGRRDRRLRHHRQFLRIDDHRRDAREWPPGGSPRGQIRCGRQPAEAGFTRRTRKPTTTRKSTSPTRSACSPSSSSARPPRLPRIWPAGRTRARTA